MSYMPYARHSFDIAAYTFQASTLCAACCTNAVQAAFPYFNGSTTVTELWLAEAAQYAHVDRDDERSYDSGYFPKVVFVDQLVDGETCDHCGGVL